MRNFFIIHASINFKGGVGTVIKNLITYQIDKGYKVGILYIENSKDELSFFAELMDKIEIITFKRPNIKGINTLLGIPMRKIYLQLQKEYPTENIIFHAHNTVAVGILSRIQYVPLLCTLHGINSSKTLGSQQSMKWILNKLQDFNKPIISVSKNTAEHYFKGQLDNNRVKIINNGVKVERKTVNKKKDYFNIGYVSYIDDLKGWKFLFEAFVMLTRDYSKKVKLTIAGEGSLNQVNELKSLIKYHKLEDVVFYQGYVNNAEEKIFPYLDVLVLPSKSEGMPMTILEALGNGVPVLATAVGGIPEVLKDGYNGMFIKRDVSDIYSKLRVMVDNKNIYNSIKNNAYPSYLENFTLEAMGKKYDEIYLQMERT